MFLLLAGCSLSVQVTTKPEPLLPESVTILHQEELEKGRLLLFREETGFGHAFLPKEAAAFNTSQLSELFPPEGISWTMFNDPHVPIVTFAGSITDETITQVLIRQKTEQTQAQIIQTEQGRFWFAYFDHLEDAAPGEPDPLQVEALSDKGDIIWKNGVYDGKFFSGRVKK